ncbi:VanZ family protein [Planococcus versutus]|uniref:VanZ family protein n=1 Tax=Planococcus versutus TaxID=1302659 RepID=UPI000ACBF8F6|nr:VanZ family protein [Planococcus versutus]
MRKLKTKHIPVIFWALCILVATNNFNFQALLFAREINFDLYLFPDFSDLFDLSSIHLDSRLYVFQKIGHVISFAILFWLAARSIGDNTKAIVLCSLFAFFTEVLQLFFHRTGRLTDVLIDIGGIYLAYRLSGYIKEQGGLVPAFWTTLQKIGDVFSDDKSN